jgi:Ca2+-binding RTX toxin-like protein|tara:strand:+ start:3205 stop:3567 length:363 start_codon:yes stop_codon:yes gene_type:complete
MIQINNYQDIQIMQDATFSNIITFDSEYDTALYSYEAKIAKDRKGTSFAWGAGTTTSVAFTISKTDETTLTLTLTADNTKNFGDDFEGVWDLLSKKTVGGEMVRESEGDVVVSPSVTASF